MGIGDRKTFADLRRHGRRGSAANVWVRSLRGDAPPQVAFAISRTVGTAVTRNRLRRRLRAHLAARDLAPGAYLVGSSSPEAAELTFDALGDELSTALERADAAGSGRHR